MEFTINLSDHISETEMKEIARDEFRSAIRNFFSTKNDMYNLIWYVGNKEFEKIIENEIPQYKEAIKKEVKKSVENTKNYGCYVFHRATKYSDYDSPDSLGYQYLQEAIENNKGVIENKVKEIISRLDEDDIRDKIIDIIYDYMCRKPKE